VEATPGAATDLEHDRLAQRVGCCQLSAQLPNTARDGLLTEQNVRDVRVRKGGRSRHRVGLAGSSSERRTRANAGRVAAKHALGVETHFHAPGRAPSVDGGRERGTNKVSKSKIYIYLFGSIVSW
jgi:hypothetical protein